MACRCEVCHTVVAYVFRADEGPVIEQKFRQKQGYPWTHRTTTTRWKLANPSMAAQLEIPRVANGAAPPSVARRTPSS